LYLGLLTISNIIFFQSRRRLAELQPARGRRVMPEKDASADSESKCRIAEITQFSCEPKKNQWGRPEVHCVPIPRLFRM
jgi:hypothetical protein